MKSYDTLSKIAEYACRLFIGAERERLYLLLFNNRMNMIDCAFVSEGAVNSSLVHVRRMTELALLKKASSVVVVHNHPDGLAVPSSNDLAVTETLCQAFETLNIFMLEHLVVADDRVCPILHQKRKSIRFPYQQKEIESCFLEKFYDIESEEWRCPPFIL